jgi:choline dehydrogenase-like flavoprotein
MYDCQRSQDLQTFIAAVEAAAFGAAGHVVFSAHQMGSARMGNDPRTSAAQPSGELHDADNVWIGDTSAFPTAPGVNPMITCMALAARTAEHIAG